ncbi:MAG: Mur ligase domain-containing protein [Rickettsiales bacterium]|jgi:UDP-N-acetylmuramate--alanine ligase|nr:Mur ligase domain-containing protein [Rickettsiales bacterium]
MKKVHFVGINGSGICGVACIAKNFGYEVDGCDMNAIGDYTHQLVTNGIKFLVGHDVSHLKDKDIVVISPALLFKDKHKSIPEVTRAIETLPTIIWQKFLEDYIFRKQNVVVVSGTHGKTTTTTLTALMLERLDPTAIIGGEVKEWKQSFRVGKSDWFVVEGDEYGGNFLNYNPRYLLINNLEMEHPEYFKDFDDYLDNFRKMFRNVQDNGKIIFPYFEENILNLINESKDYFRNKNVEIVCYDFVKRDTEFKFYLVEQGLGSVKINNETLVFKILGEHNMKNVISSSITAIECGIDCKEIQKVLDSFTGSKRRLDLVFENDRIKIYDDYAHHHTQIKTTIEALKNNLEKNEKIIAILEPHLISRIAQNTEKYRQAMKIADLPIITKIYKSRESDMEDPDMPKLINDNSIEYIENFDDILIRIRNYIFDNKEYKFRVLVMGAGYSYKLTKMLKNIC